MFNVKIGNEYLSLAKGSKISLEFNSSLFDNELFKGSYSFPIDFDLSPKNIRLTDFRHIIQSKTRLETPIPITLEIANSPYKKATLRLDFSNQNKMSGYILLDSGSIADALNSIKLNTVDYGGNIVIGETLTAKMAHISAKAPMAAVVDDYTFFPVHNPNFYGAETDSVNAEFTENNKVINYYDPILDRFLNNQDFVTSSSHTKFSFVPFPSLVFVIKKICEHIGYKAVGDFIDDAEIKTAVIYNTVAIDDYVTFPTYVVNSYKNYINIQNHVPNLTIGEFLHAVRNFFFVNIEIDATRKIIEFTKFKSIFNDSRYIDLSKNTSKSYEHKPFSTNGIEFDFGLDSNDELFEANNYESKSIIGPSIGDKKSFGSIASTLFMLKEDRGPAFWDTLIPQAIQRGNSLEDQLNDEEFSDTVLGQNDYSLRFLFYRGRHSGERFTKYPLGSSDIYNYRDEVVGNTSLHWEGDNGRKVKYAEEFINFWQNTKPITFTKLFTYNELLEMKTTRKVMIHGIKGFISKINVDSDFKTKPGKIQIYTQW